MYVGVEESLPLGFGLYILKSVVLDKIIVGQRIMGQRVCEVYFSCHTEKGKDAIIIIIGARPLILIDDADGIIMHVSLPLIKDKTKNTIPPQMESKRKTKILIKGS